MYEIGVDESSPWRMNSNVSNVSVFNVTVALAKVHDRMCLLICNVVESSVVGMLFYWETGVGFGCDPNHAAVE